MAADVKGAFGFQKTCNFNAFESVTVASLFVISISTKNTYFDRKLVKTEGEVAKSLLYKSAWLYRNNYKCHDTYFNSIQCAVCLKHETKNTF